MKIVKAFLKSKVFTITTALILVVLIAVNLVITQIPLVSNTFNTIFGEERRVLVSGDPASAQYYTLSEGITNKAEALAYANGVNERICEEGFVLLKNQDNALPLASGSKVTVYGMNSVDLVYGGSGSAAKDAGNSIDLYQSLDIAGIAYNPEMKSFYEGQLAAGKGRPRSPDMGDIPEGFATGELPVSAYSGGLFASVGEYTTAALMVISRIGGEGYDLPTRSVGTEGRSDETQHYLELDDNEKALLEGLCAEDSPFEKVIVLINCGTSMELDFLRDENTYNGKLKAALWIGTAGGTGMSAMGKILTGLVNPSGRLVDTYAVDFTKTPSYQNFSVNNGQGNTYLVNGTDQDAHFVDYEEGIYVGYRYYETRGAGNEDWYEENVVFPFGYGLSYSTFQWEIEDDRDIYGVTVQKDGTYTVKVKVTNQGPYPGKDVVQLYGHAPYTAGGIEKPEVVLVGFAKTGLLQAYESEIVEIPFNPYYLASYDDQGIKAQGGGFVLEAGSGYELYVSRNAHDRSMVIPFTVGADLIYKEAAVEGCEVENRFDEVTAHIETYLSRSDWNGTFPATPGEEERTVDGTFMDQLTMEAYIGQGSSLDTDKPWYSARKPRQKRKQQTFDTTEVKLYQLIGKSYDDPLWDRLLGQLTYDEMRYLIGTGNFNTAGLENIDKPKTTDPDGPAGFTNFMTVIDGTATVYDTCFYASECVIAATWNVDLVEEMGQAIGNEALIGNERGDGKSYSGWYAPAVNIHRTQFSGRNWEYYSEDGFLSGRMAASVIQGAKSKGVYTYVKHFAVNDQETNRDTNGLITWLSEQSLREIYLRPFEMAVKEGGTNAMMSSFNRIGTVWAGGSYELLTNVLRQEWGFQGMVITDYNTNPYMYPDQMIRAGGDLDLMQDKQPSASGDIVTASHQTAIRRAVKNILYTVVNSNAMNGMGDGIRYRYAMPYWKMVLIAVDVGVVLVLGFWGYSTARKNLRKQTLAK